MAGVGPPASHNFPEAISRSRPAEPICPSPDCLLWGCRVGAAGSSGPLDWKENWVGGPHYSVLGCGKEQLWYLAITPFLPLLLGSLWAEILHPCMSHSDSQDKTQTSKRKN